MKVFAILTVSIIGLVAGLGLFILVPILIPLFAVVISIISLPFIAFAAMDPTSLNSNSDLNKNFNQQPIDEDASKLHIVTNAVQVFSSSEQINQIQSSGIFDLLNRMPANGWHLSEFDLLPDGGWAYNFQFNSVNVCFDAEGEGKSPRDAF